MRVTDDDEVNLGKSRYWTGSRIGASRSE
jgi:hypothetical protein